ncbi:hypothetical protein HOK51_01825 [Candidatus Woesearchaeota archaeon]|jgi:hypothetical protein|nr:hypothetical protein [Candidatus Woesearchaeota archaeon]MBT7368426.1 hypothetical protein [Candidatus Woesearchaeota archaeon]
MKYMNYLTRKIIIGLAAAYLSACNPLTETPTKKETYVGTIQGCGEVELKTYYNPEKTPEFVVNIEAELLDDPSKPFRRHSMVDENNDGIFEYGTYPYRPNGTNIVMSRNVFSEDIGSERSDFKKLNQIVNYALDSRGKELKKMEN